MHYIDNIRSAALFRNTKGVSTVEYVIILCLLAVLAIGTWNKFGNAVRKKLTSATTDFSTNVKH